MSETQAVADQNFNPFDDGNFASGGGLWDGKTVTLTSVEARTQALTYKDGSPVKDAKTGEQSILTALFVTGISDGPDDKERKEEYSVGDRLAPTPDGEGFVNKEGGGPVKFHENSGMAKLSKALKASGFDIATLIELVPGAPPRMRLKKLVGARFVFKAEAQLGKDGKPLKDKKGYDKNRHLPVKFVGYAGKAGATATPSGNGGASPSTIETKAQTRVVDALTKAGGKLTRADLVRELAVAGAGDPDSNAVIGLVIQDGWHKGQKWVYDGTHASLA